MASSEAVTRNIRVRVTSRLDPRRSRPAQGFWFYLYTVSLTNEGDETVQLLDRQWVISDDTGRTEEVVGQGVVGQQPTLDPGQSFDYTSGCPLLTRSGTMHGTYGMITDGGEPFRVEIPAFFLGEEPTVH